MGIWWKLTTQVVGVALLSATQLSAQENQALSLADVKTGVPTAAIIPAGPPPAPNTVPLKIAIPGPDTDLPFKDLIAAGIVKDQAALIRLGKALFWDMQAGSDGVQSCATCHFHAGADSRSKNQISPGLDDTNFTGPFISGDNHFGNSTVPYTARDIHTPNPPGPSEPPLASLEVPGFPQFRPNYQLSAADFPLNDWLRPTERTPRGPRVNFLEEFANVSRDTNDVISSQGVRHTMFTGVTAGNPVDQGTPAPDIFNLASPGEVNANTLVRRVPMRNAPTVINAVFNFDNFWDGRASFIFNGVNPFGFRDRLSTLKQTTPNEITPTSGGTITDGAGNKWTLTLAGMVEENGTAVPRGSDTSALVIADGVIYGQDAATHAWFTYSPTSKLWTSSAAPVDDKGKLSDVYLRVTHSSLASQAVGPTTSNFEMSFENRTFPDVGKKMLSLRPLAKQLVHPEDSVLGSLSQAHLDAAGKLAGSPGLSTATYVDMVDAAFKEAWWKSTEIIAREPNSVSKQAASTNNPRTMVRNLGRGSSLPGAAPGFNPGAQLDPDHYTQAEWNFSLFWGLAIQAYEETLRADDTPYDRFEGSKSRKVDPDPNALTPSQRSGLAIFTDEDPNLGARCNNCHSLPVATNHSVADIVQGNINRPDFQGRPADIIEFMSMGDGAIANYDKGFYNIGVRRSSEDVGLEGTAPASTPQDPQLEFENPLDGNKPFPLSYVALGHLAAQGKLPDDVLRFVQLDPKTRKPVPVLDRQAIHGNFKAPNLRNTRLTGPYFHNGDSATLRQVVEFYTRGGNFPNTNFHDLDPDIEGIPGLRFPEFLPSARQRIEDLVNFVSEGLTDARVVLEQAPFDHPQLFVPNGTQDFSPGVDDFLEIQAVGRRGHPNPIDTFLTLDPQSP